MNFVLTIIFMLKLRKKQHVRKPVAHSNDVDQIVFTETDLDNTRRAITDH